MPDATISLGRQESIRRVFEDAGMDSSSLDFFTNPIPIDNGKRWPSGEMKADLFVECTTCSYSPLLGCEFTILLEDDSCEVWFAPGDPHGVVDVLLSRRTGWDGNWQDVVAQARKWVENTNRFLPRPMSGLMRKSFTPN